MFKVVLLVFLISFTFVEKGYSEEEYINTDHGSLKVINKNSSVVVSAPHGTYDINTGAITHQVCNELNVGCIIAKGFVPKGIRINVNRPTEGVGKKWSQEPVTARASEVYKKYKAEILKITNNNLKWYFEVHGSREKGMEIALHNITHGEAIIIKSILKEEWSTYSSNKVSIKVQSIDNIEMTGGAVKKFGIVHELQPKYVQFEFSKKLRKNKSLLSKFLVRSINRITSEI